MIPNALLATFAGVLLLAGAGLAADALLLPPGHADAAPSGAPTLDDALHRLARHDAIRIGSLADFAPRNGVRQGSGTAADPFVLEGVYAPSLVVRNVSAAFVLRDDYVAGELVLDWTGPGMLVENVTAGLLETNTNRPHAVAASWGTIQDSRFGDVVLRHAGGVFARNVVGPSDATDPTRLALNIEGYDGLLVASNDVRGPTEIRLHGHHFADSFADAWMPMDMMGNSTDRFVALRVEGNTFEDPSGHGVDISDRAHAANDRTAKSEPDPVLDSPHRHFTDIEIDNDTLVGAGIVVTDANAADPHHLPGGVTRIHLADDAIVDPLGGVGVRIESARLANITLDRVDVSFREGRVAGSAGVLVREMRGGSLDVRDSSFANLDDGVRAHAVSANASWSVTGTRFRAVGTPVDWDASVKAAPTQAGNVATA